MNKLYIRADGNSSIGLGHIMRSMTIAKAFRDNGFDCIYITSTPSDKEIFDINGFSSIEVDYAYDEKTVEEATEIKDLLIQNEARFILVDSYYTTNQYLEILRSAATVICINSTKRFLATDYLINENIACNKEYIEELYSGSGTKLLLGSEYSPIRNEFDGTEYKVSEEVGNILITTGGGDQYDFMTQLIRRIKKDLFYEKYSYLFVSGKWNEHYSSLVEVAEGCSNIHVVKDARNMSELMKKADVAISAGGTTVLELSVTGVPTLGISVADDQIDGLSFMGNVGMILYAGRITDDPFWETFFIKFRRLLTDLELRKKLSEKARSKLDNRGAYRIFKQIVEDK